LNIGSFHLRYCFDAFPKKGYAYGLTQAVSLAKNLGHKRVAALEFGVAGGNGLVALEQLARMLEAERGVEVSVFGFDTGVGLPSTGNDYRDLPYHWQQGFYRMDVEKLRRRLTKAQLILGDVRDTVAPFISQLGDMPIGFVSFDLDYYSSTAAALRLFDAAAPTQMLPRLFVYFDDVIGASDELYNEYTGQLLAIREFNAAHENMKLAQIRHLRRPYALNMYCLHQFAHPDYCTFIGEKNQQAPLS
jgi:hypothetical protein